MVVYPGSGILRPVYDCKWIRCVGLHTHSRSMFEWICNLCCSFGCHIFLVISLYSYLFILLVCVYSTPCSLPLDAHILKSDRSNDRWRCSVPALGKPSSIPSQPGRVAKRSQGLTTHPHHKRTHTHHTHTHHTHTHTTHTHTHTHLIHRWDYIVMKCNSRDL